MGKFKYEVYDYSKVGIYEPKKWQSTWTVALSNDINIYTNATAERTLTATLSTQIAQEIDRSILASLTGTFSSTGPTFTPTYISTRDNFITTYSNGTI
jgi:hypothetical protein